MNIFFLRSYLTRRHYSPLFWQKIAVFSVTFISFALYHASRKNLSGVKVSVANDWVNGTTYFGQNSTKPLFNTVTEAKKFLGFLDALFMAFYAGALFFWGYLGDRLNPRNVVTFGMVTSGISLGLFSLVPYYCGFYDIPWYLVMWAFFGVAQACGWPNNVAIMGNWFGKGGNGGKNSGTGFILGLWSANQSVGNIFGSLLVSIVIKFGYMRTFIVNVVLLFLGAALVQNGIHPSPRDYQDLNESGDSSFNEDADVDEDHHDVPQPVAAGDSNITVRVRSSSNSSRHSPTNQQDSRHEPREHVSLSRAILLPGVLPYCLCNACLKLVNYAFFFWLPFYLAGNYHWSEAVANGLSIWYDIGGIFGSVLGGLISDRIGFRTPVIMGMLMASILCLLIYANLGASQVMNMIVMFFLGASIAGPYNLIVGTISVDLGTQKALRGNKEAMSTVSGLIDGTGSAGSAVGQILVPFVQDTFGWSRVFYMFIFANVLAIICLLQRFIQDVREMKALRNSPTIRIE